MKEMLGWYQVKVQSGDYDLLVVLKGDILVVTNIKTTKQRKYRGLVEFYHELYEKKENSVDKMLRGFGRMSLEEEIKENLKYTDKLGIDMEDVKNKYKDAARELVLKELEELVIQ